MSEIMENQSVNIYDRNTRRWTIGSLPSGYWGSAPISDNLGTTQSITFNNINNISPRILDVTIIFEANTEIWSGERNNTTLQLVKILLEKNEPGVIKHKDYESDHRRNFQLYYDGSVLRCVSMLYNSVEIKIFDNSSIILILTLDGSNFDYQDFESVTNPFISVPISG